MSRILRVGLGYGKECKGLCTVCEREFIGKGLYCSAKCRQTAKDERRHTRNALTVPISLGFTLAFEDRSRAMVIVPDYLEEFFPKNGSQFYVFAKHDVSQSVLFENDIIHMFISNVGGALWDGIGNTLKIGGWDETLKRKYLLGYAERMASSGIYGFTCSSCKRTLLKNGISASDCAGKCYHCCTGQFPF